MKSALLLVGLVSWSIVLTDFALAFVFRRSTLRFIWACTALGFPLFFLRELRWLPLNYAWAVAVLGITSGVAFAALLLGRLLGDPRVLK